MALTDKEIEKLTDAERFEWLKGRIAEMQRQQAENPVPRSVRCPVEPQPIGSSVRSAFSRIAQSLNAPCVTSLSRGKWIL